MSSNIYGFDFYGYLLCNSVLAGNRIFQRKNQALLDSKNQFHYYPKAKLTFVFLNFFPISKQLRVNRLIRVPTVRLIDENDEQMGIKSIEEALHMAEERGFDLVEVAPKANPPVCKILDYANIFTA